ncbi:MAG: ribosome maturation factor RimM [Bacilli bacterium]|nr:ribosome maturation factor RimM [Bacilli bacterium]
MEYVRLAKILKTYGLKGEVKAYCLTDFPASRFKKGNVLSFLNEKTGERENYTVSSYRLQKPFIYLKFEEIISIEHAENVLGMFVEIEKDKAPMPDGYYRLEDLKGCTVESLEGEQLGVVEDILSYSTTKTLRVKKADGKTFTVPFVFDHFVVSVDLDSKTIVIKVIPGLL